MACRGKTIRRTNGKNAEFILGALPTNIKYEFTDDRIRKCQKCLSNIWFGRNLFCVLFMRKAGRTLWPDPTAFVPARARVKNETCPLHKWPMVKENNRSYKRGGR